MSKNKKYEPNLLIPGAQGWNIWSCSSQKIELLNATDKTEALDIKKFPQNKPLMMAFPVNELTAIELRVPKEQTDSIADLVELQVEKTGLSQEENFGTLHQHTLLGATPNGEENLYRIDVLRAPEEGSLPEKSPDTFSVSPSCFPFAPNSLTFWQEFGKWVVNITDQKGDTVHYQGFTDTKLDMSMIEGTKFIIGQLLIQDIIQCPPEVYIIWTEEEGIYPEGYEVLEEALKGKLKLVTKPAPLLPKEAKLLPADTRAERRAAKVKQRNNILGALFTTILLGVFAFAGYKLITLEKKAKTAQAEAKKLASDSAILTQHSQKWQELGPLVDTENDPVSLLLKCNKAIPSSDVRLTRAEFKHQFPSEGLNTVVNIILTGETNEFSLASKYDENLQKSPDLKNISWENQDPAQKKTGWGFTFRGEEK